mmetsp:Transcript_29085/g.94162  ORF Transcript_29085/g.94162 Transcript_29085/m.94162 type:complete len:223 (-) Transcript_29085:373-1041(-)
MRRTSMLGRSAAPPARLHGRAPPGRRACRGGSGRTRRRWDRDFESGSHELARSRRRRSAFPCPRRRRQQTSASAAVVRPTASRSSPRGLRGARASGGKFQKKGRGSSLTGFSRSRWTMARRAHSPQPMWAPPMRNFSCSLDPSTMSCAMRRQSWLDPSAKCGKWSRKKPKASCVTVRQMIVAKASWSKGSWKALLTPTSQTLAHMTTGSVKRTSNGSTRSTK